MICMLFEHSPCHAANRCATMRATGATVNIQSPHCNCNCATIQPWVAVLEVSTVHANYRKLLRVAFTTLYALVLRILAYQDVDYQDHAVSAATWCVLFAAALS